MRHLLLTRFQGGLMGGNVLYLTPQQIAPNQLATGIMPVFISGISSLVRSGGFKEEDWLDSTFTTTKSPHQAMLAMLPLMLFFHDDRDKLREIIVSLSHRWDLDWETCSSAIAISYIISRSISETFSLSAILPQLLDETTNLHPLLFQQLSTIDRLLAQSSSLSQTSQKLSLTAHPTITPTTLAIYCFLSTPVDFSLAIRRAYQNSAPEFTCALTGILSGVYNSSTGIPLNGLLATQQRQQYLALAESLLNLWAGVYQLDPNPSVNLLPPTSQPAFMSTLPVATPKVIQRR